MISVRGLNKNYAGRPVIRDLSLDLPRGRLTSIIGANGAGKSTLLGLISRLIKPDSGEILIEGRSIGEYKPRLLAQKISILKQQNNVNLRLRLDELVAFGRFPHSQGRLTREDRAKIDQALEYTDLAGLRGEFLNTLSGGQRQRAFIAMILAQDSEFIMFDEPLNNLDLKHAVSLMKFMKSLASDLGKSLAVVLHDLNFASLYSDELIALKDGTLLAQGPAREVITEEILSQTFDMPIPIHELEGRRFCLYF